MPSKLALHFQQLPGWAGNTAARWVKVIDPPSENRWPGKLVIGRAYMPDEQSNGLVAMGSAGAELWFRHLQPHIARAPYVHAWEAPNEPQPVDQIGYASALGAFTRRLAEIMHEAGRRVVGGNLSEGNPGGDEATRKACFQAIARGLQYCDYWSQHCYWVMGYSHPEAGMNEWHAFRYRMNVRYATEAGIRLPPLLITECGVDGGVVALPKKGWRTFCRVPQIYIEQLRQFDAELAKDAYVLAATVFTAGPTGDWADFDVTQELSGMIDAHIKAQGGAYQPAVSLAAALAAEFGDAFEDLSGSLPKGTPPYSKRPLSDVQFAVIHHSETPRSTTWQSVAAYHVNTNKWPGIAYHVGIRKFGDQTRVSLLNEPDVRSYHAHSVGNNSGVAVCFMGSFDKGEPYPDEVEAGRRVVAAIRAYLGRRIGVLGHGQVPGNDTACPGLHLIQALPIIDGADGSLDSLLRVEAAKRQVIQFNPDAALQRRIFADGFVPNSPEFEVTHSDKTYIAQRAEKLGARVARVYAVEKGNWSNVFTVEG